ncbi:hypothetical protein C8R47DRAFT_1177608 [Mycena vitilis]|nr:hypothetical protein C8R47DRAFT_1177608 [Mycena vitilis]
MAPTPNPRVLFAKIPGYGLPVSGEHIVFDATPTIDLDLELNGGFLTKTLLLSFHSGPIGNKFAQRLVGFGLVIVLRSEKEGIKAGDYMFGFTPWEAYTVQPYKEGMRLIRFGLVPEPQGAFPWPKYCSCLGAPGLTAYIGLEHLRDAKAGQTIYVSAGASGVGSVVIQLCKSKGLKVIASAGTDAKTFNYKTTPAAVALKEHGPLDVFFDNVGGEQLDAALENMNMNGRVIGCGSISDYNIPKDQRYGIKNMNLLFGCKIVAQEQLFEGLDNGPEAFLSMFNGTSTSKPVVVVDPKYGV